MKTRTHLLLLPASLLLLLLVSEGRSQLIQGAQHHTKTMFLSKVPGLGFPIRDVMLANGQPQVTHANGEGFRRRGAQGSLGGSKLGSSNVFPSMQHPAPPRPPPIPVLRPIPVNSQGFVQQMESVQQVGPVPGVFIHRVQQGGVISSVQSSGGFVQHGGTVPGSSSLLKDGFVQRDPGFTQPGKRQAVPDRQRKPPTQGGLLRPTLPQPEPTLFQPQPSQPSQFQPSQTSQTQPQSSQFQPQPTQSSQTQPQSSQFQPQPPTTRPQSSQSSQFQPQPPTTRPQSSQFQPSQSSQPQPQPSQPSHTQPQPSQSSQPQPQPSQSSHTQPQRDPFCTVLPDPGECRAAFPRYYYNKRTGQCDCFLYGGCGHEGLQSSYRTLEECQRKCLPENTAEGPSCDAVFRRNQEYFTFPVTPPSHHDRPGTVEGIPFPSTSHITNEELEDLFSATEEEESLERRFRRDLRMFG